MTGVFLLWRFLPVFYIGLPINNCHRMTGVFLLWGFFARGRGDHQAPSAVK